MVPEAYLAYLKGRFFWNKRTEAGLRKAIEYFDEAIAKDPTYASAHAGMADSYALLGSNGYDAMPPREAMPRAKTAAVEALALDNGLAEAHTSLAYVLMAYDWDLPAARKEFQEAFRYNPGYATAHHWYSHYLLAAGQPDQALAEMKQALALDPLSLSVNVGVGWCSYFARRYDEAIGQYQKTLELEPDFALARQALGMALVFMLVMRMVWRELLRQPSQADSKLRRWLTYLALLLAAGTLIGDLVAFVEHLLRGEITARFAAKIVVVLALAGGVFWFYLRSVQPGRRGENLRRHGRAGAAAAAAWVALTLVLSFARFGSPATQRLSASDDRRTEDLEAISRVIWARWISARGTETPMLPQSITCWCGRGVPGCTPCNHTIVL